MHTVTSSLLWSLPLHMITRWVISLWQLWNVCCTAATGLMLEGRSVLGTDCMLILLDINIVICGEHTLCLLTAHWPFT